MIATIGPSLGGLAAVMALAAGLSVLIGATVLSHQADAPYSAALVYLVLGAGAAVVLNRLDVGWPDALDHLDAVQHLAAAAIVIALFGTGLKIDRTISWQGWSSIVRLLLFAMPLVIAAVAVLGVEALGVPLGVAIMIGAMLAPTDPVLAGEIGVGPPGESDEREERFAITGEAGLNDGLALIFVLFGLGYLESGERSIPNWLLVDVGYSLVAAVAVGLVVGRGVGWLAMRERNRHELDPGVESFVGLGAAFVLYGAAGSIGANGFIAVFVGALAFRRYEHRHELNRGVWDGLERAGRLAELAAIVLLGTVLSIDGLASIGWSGWLIVALVLLVIRPASVFVTFIGSRRTSRTERAVIAWFGVRGLASIYYAAAIGASGALTAEQQSLLWWMAVATVVVSIVVHGLTGTQGMKIVKHRNRRAMCPRDRGAQTSLVTTNAPIRSSRMARRRRW